MTKYTLYSHYIDRGLVFLFQFFELHGKVDKNASGVPSENTHTVAGIKTSISSSAMEICRESVGRFHSRPVILNRDRSRPGYRRTDDDDSALAVSLTSATRRHRCTHHAMDTTKRKQINWFMNGLYMRLTRFNHVRTTDKGRLCVLKRSR